MHIRIPKISWSNIPEILSFQQAINGISQISFSAEGKVSPKKPTTLPEVAKQRELSGTLKSESNAKVRKHLSDAKCKELSGNNIFGPPSETPPRSLAAARSSVRKESKDMVEPAPRNLRTSVRVSNVSLFVGILFSFMVFISPRLFTFQIWIFRLC